MKRFLALITVFGALLALAACGDTASSAPPASSAPAASSQPTSVAQPESTPADSTPAETDGADVQAMLETIAAAAGLGDGPIDVMEIDLRAGEVDAANIESFAGYESKTSSQNGGIVVVIKAVAGTADTVAADLEKFKQSRMGNPDYADFEQARINTENARIVKNGDYVVYAVSAEGDAGWAALDAAIAAALGT